MRCKLQLTYKCDKQQFIFTFGNHEPLKRPVFVIPSLMDILGTEFPKFPPLVHEFAKYDQNITSSLLPVFPDTQKMKIKIK